MKNAEIHYISVEFWIAYVPLNLAGKPVACPWQIRRRIATSREGVFWGAYKSEAAAREQCAMFIRHWDGESLEAHQLKDTQFRHARLHACTEPPASLRMPDHRTWSAS
jgi:hypothetical protein